MKLLLNPTSPYARVVRIAAIETGLEPKLSLVWVDPWANDDELLAVNPMAKVPTLVTESGHPISESLLILSYLDQVTETSSLFPKARDASVLQLAGLGQGLIDASFNTVVHRKHEGKAADNSLLGQRRLAAINRTVDAVEDLLHHGNLPGFSAGHIILGVALEYLNFRLPEIAWRQNHPSLNTLSKALSSRDSFVRTVFT